MSNYKTVRSLHRGLDVLCALNRHSGASVPALSEATGIHRTTVRRLLETLQLLGYVEKSPSDENYRLTLNVRRLSEGFDDDAWVSAVAGPALRELHPKILWPTDVATYDYDAMLIRESSHRYSPFSIHHALVGQRLPILRSALGQVYLAFCQERERREILDILRASRGPDAALARDAAFLRELIRRTRRNGYAAKHGDQEKRVSAIAVPILRGERVFASLTMVYFRSAMTLPAAVQKYVEPLREAAAAMAARLGTDSAPVGALPAVARNTSAMPESALKQSGNWSLKTL